MYICQVNKTERKQNKMEHFKMDLSDWSREKQTELIAETQIGKMETLMHDIKNGQITNNHILKDLNDIKNRLNIILQLQK